MLEDALIILDRLIEPLRALVKDFTREHVLVGASLLEMGAPFILFLGDTPAYHHQFDLVVFDLRVIY